MEASMPSWQWMKIVLTTPEGRALLKHVHLSNVLQLHGPASFSDAAALFAVKKGAEVQGVHSDSDDSAVGASAKQHYNADSSGADSDVAVNRSSAAKAADRTIAKQRSGKHSKKSAEDQIDDLLMSSDDDAISATSQRRRAHSSSSSKKRAAAGQTAGLQQQQKALVALAVGMAVEARFGGRVSLPAPYTTLQ
jgi:hypothetical protein